MALREIGERARDCIFSLSRIINGVGVSCVMLMMLLMVVDVILRRVFDSPITGSFEVVQFLLVSLVFMGLAYTTVKKAHISIDLVTSQLSKMMVAYLNSLTLLMGLGLMVLISWRNFLRAGELREEQATSALLSVPLFPFYYLIALCCAVLCLVLLVQFIEALAGVWESVSLKRGILLYALGLVAITVPVAVSFHWVEWAPNPLMAGLLGIAVLFLLMVSGMPIAFAMGIVGLAGYCLIIGVDAGLSQLDSVPYGVGSDYVLSVLPLFLLRDWNIITRAIMGAVGQWYSSIHHESHLA